MKARDLVITYQTSGPYWYEQASLDGTVVWSLPDVDVNDRLLSDEVLLVSILAGEWADMIDNGEVP